MNEPIQTPQEVRASADTVEHQHDYKIVPNRERTDRLAFVCAQYKCYECGDAYFM